MLIYISHITVIDFAPPLLMAMALLFLVAFKTWRNIEISKIPKLQRVRQLYVTEKCRKIRGAKPDLLLSP